MTEPPLPSIKYEVTGPLVVAVITVEESVNEGVELNPSVAVVLPKNLLIAAVFEEGPTREARDQFPMLLLNAVAL